MEARDIEAEFGGYHVRNVYGRVDEPLRREILGLWLDHRVLDPVEAQRRVAEVAFTIRAPDGTLAGVNTVYIADFRRKGERYYFLRMFIRPADRGVFGLRGFVTRTTRAFLRGHGDPRGRPLGVIIVTENPKYWRRGARRMLERDGWRYFGKGPLGREIWYDNFDGSEITG